MINNKADKQGKILFNLNNYKYIYKTINYK